jgi:ABC-2 type transport system ATP-binding protein
MNVISFDDIHRAYKRGENVLDGVGFDVAPGEVVGLLGRNGAGKTTLIRIAMGMIEPQKGSVRLFGMDPRQDPLEVKRRVGYVSEDQILPEFLRVRDVIRLHRELFPTWDRNLAGTLVERFELPMRHKIKTLSRGQARQVALLCAMAHRPELLLLDEPAGGLDPAVRREFLETAIQYLNESGSTILFSSHYMGDVERLAQRIVMLHDGKVLIDNGLDELREEFSLALIPLDSGTTRERLQSAPSCLAVRRRSDAFHAVFRQDPETTAHMLRHELGVTASRCQSIPLEEMFIEIVGGRS